MKKCIALGFVAFFAFTWVVDAQTRNPSPTPTPIDPRIAQANEISRRSEALRNTENHPVRINENNKVLRTQIKPLYRKLNKKERKLMQPDAEIAAEYSGFLKQKNTGLIVLVNDQGCSQDQKVLQVRPNCADYTMPGAGSAYSFRENRHRLISLADLNFRKNTLQALGTMTHGIMVNLEDVPIETVSLKTKGMAFLSSIKPASDFKKAADLATRLKKGIKEGDFIYASLLPANEGKTYALRSIAYRGESLVKIAGYLINEFDFDKRRDVIVVFRLVKLEPGKRATILWKVLQSKKAPKLQVK